MKMTSMQLGSSIDFRIIGLIAGLGILVYLQPFFPTGIQLIDETGFAYALGSAGASIMAFVVSTRYKGSKVFGKAYFALGYWVT